MGRARDLRKRIEVWQTEKVPDGFGGNTVTDLKLTETWAEIRTFETQNKYNVSPVTIGIFDPGTALKIRVRKRNDLNYEAINLYLVYAGIKYIIATKPVDVDFNHRFIEFVAAVESTRTVNDNAPIGGLVFPYTFNFLFPI